MAPAHINDQEAAELVEACRRFLARFHLQAHDRQELAQEATAQTLRFAPQVRDAGRLQAVGRTIARRLVYHRRVHGGPLPVSLTDMPEPWTTDRNPAERAERAELIQVLQAALEAAEPRVRHLLRRHYVDGVSMAELGQELGCSAGAVKRRVLKARNRVRLAMGEVLNTTGDPQPPKGDE